MDRLTRSQQRAKDAAIEKKSKEAGDGFILFDGMKGCANDCRGWQQYQHRCDCGNRRVKWDAWQNPDGSWHVYATGC